MRRIQVAVLAVVLAACSADDAPLVATDVVVTEPRPGTQMTAGYLALSNNSAQPITITRVLSSEFASVEMHESVIEDGVARMYPLGELTVPDGGKVTFEPGGKHLMLTQPTADSDSVSLEFYAGEAVVLTVNVPFTE
jgi:copper(I)-binding protein